MVRPVSLITASLMMRGTNDAWQNVSSGNLRILDKNGGLNNTSTYIGFAPQRKLGVVILLNRGKKHATGIGRQILHALARDQSQPSTEGEPGIVGCGTGSLRLGLSPIGVPRRSQTHTRVNFATPVKTVGLDLSEMSQSSAEALRPPTKTAVGDPLPVHFRYILRPPPMSTDPAKLPFSAAWATATPSGSMSGTITISNMSNRNDRFIQ